PSRLRFEPGERAVVHCHDLLLGHLLNRWLPLLTRTRGHWSFLSLLQLLRWRLTARVVSLSPEATSLDCLFEGESGDRDAADCPRALHLFDERCVSQIEPFAEG